MLARRSPFSFYCHFWNFHVFSYLFASRKHKFGSPAGTLSGHKYFLSPHLVFVCRNQLRKGLSRLDNEDGDNKRAQKKWSVSSRWISSGGSPLSIYFYETSLSCGVNFCPRPSHDRSPKPFTTKKAFRSLLFVDERHKKLAPDTLSSCLSSEKSKSRASAPSKAQQTAAQCTVLAVHSAAIVIMIFIYSPFSSRLLWEKTRSRVLFTERRHQNMLVVVRSSPPTRNSKNWLETKRYFSGSYFKLLRNAQYCIFIAFGRIFFCPSQSIAKEEGEGWGGREECA